MESEVVRCGIVGSFRVSWWVLCWASLGTRADCDRVVIVLMVAAG